MIDEHVLANLSSIVRELKLAERYDILLKVIGVSTLQQLSIEAAKAHLSRLVITEDYRFILPDYNNSEVEISSIHKVLYIFFLKHPEGIELKHLPDYKDELISLYRRIGNRGSEQTIANSIDRLVNPLDNSVNEKCARIKAAFAQLMDQYQLSYYAISSHVKRKIDGSSKVWYERKKVVTIPRHLVIMPDEIA